MADEAGTSRQHAQLALPGGIVRSPSHRGSRTCKRIVSYNFKGGVGKTTTCINLAAALVQRGHTVVVIDGDAQCNLSYHLLQKEVPAEDLTQYRRQRRASTGRSKRRRGEPGSGDEQPDAGDAGEQDDGAPPEQEEDGDPNEIFPAALKDKLDDEIAAEVTSNDEEEPGIDIYGYLNGFLSAMAPTVEARQMDVSGWAAADGHAMGQLLLIPGSPLVNNLDWTINSTTTSTISTTALDGYGKLACWVRLYEAIEAKHKCDYIFVDLNPGTSKLNYLAMLGADYIMPSVTAGYYDVSSCENFLANGLKGMHDYAKDIIQSAKRAADANTVLAAQFQSQGNWFPRARSDPRSEIPRLPKVLPFLMQRYKKNSHQRVTLPASRMCKKLALVVLGQAQVLNARGPGVDYKHQVSQMLFYNQAENGGPINNKSQATKMVIPFMCNVESIITLSQELGKPIVAVTGHDAKIFAQRIGRTGTAKYLEYAQNKFRQLARSMERLPLPPDFYLARN